MPLTAAQWSDSEQRYGASAASIPGVAYQPNTVLVGGGAKSVSPVNGNGLTWTGDAAAAA